MRLLHIVRPGAAGAAAADVYKIKYESTLQAERVAKLRGEIRREQDAIAALRAEWSSSTIRRASRSWRERHLRAAAGRGEQFDTLDRLPERPPTLVAAAERPPIRSARMIERRRQHEPRLGSDRRRGEAAMKRRHEPPSLPP